MLNKFVIDAMLWPSLYFFMNGLMVAAALADLGQQPRPSAVPSRLGQNRLRG
jgi:hypothetical protein